MASSAVTNEEWVLDAVEHDEAALQAWADERWHGWALAHKRPSISYGGAPMSEDWQRLDTHLDRLSQLLLEAARHGRDHWTEEQRRLYGHQPDESRPLRHCSRRSLKHSLSDHSTGSHLLW